jgi:hypothetical protein
MPHHQGGTFELDLKLLIYASIDCSASDCIAFKGGQYEQPDGR